MVLRRKNIRTVEGCRPQRSNTSEVPSQSDYSGSIDNIILKAKEDIQLASHRGTDEFKKLISEELRDLQRSDPVSKQVSCLRNVSYRFYHTLKMDGGDKKFAVKLLHLLIETFEDETSMILLAYYMTGDSDEVLKDVPRSTIFFERAIEKGNSIYSTIGLADILLNGLHGIENDPSRGLHLLREFVEQQLKPKITGTVPVRISETKTIDFLNEEKAHPFIALQFIRVLEIATINLKIDFVQASEIYEQLIDIYPVAVVSLASLLNNGVNGMHKDPLRAVRLLLKATNKFASVEMILLYAEILLENKNEEGGDTALAIQIYEHMITNCDNVDAMVSLAQFWEKGCEDVERNISNAIYLYEMAIRVGDNVQAMVSLAQILLVDNNVVARDPERAMLLLNRATNIQHNVSTVIPLAKILEEGTIDLKPDRVQAAALYKEMIKNFQNVEAMQRLASILNEGIDGIQRDTTRAICLMEKAVQSSPSKDSLLSFANMLYNNNVQDGGDIDRAVEIYKRLITEYRDVDAMLKLAKVLEQGGGKVKKNISEALRLYECAIDEHHNDFATRRLGELMLIEKNRVGMSNRRAVQLFQKSVEQSEVTTAMCKYAELLEDGGVAVKRDVAHAIVLYARAFEKSGDCGLIANVAILSLHHSRKKIC